MDRISCEWTISSGITNVESKIAGIRYAIFVRIEHIETCFENRMHICLYLQPSQIIRFHAYDTHSFPLRALFQNHIHQWASLDRHLPR